MRFLQEQPDNFYKENQYGISESSSWNHFFHDGNKYHESYFDPKTGEFMDWRKALAENDFRLYSHILDSGEYLRVIHLTCHKNFNDVKKYYKKKTKNRVAVSVDNP